MTRDNASLTRSPALSPINRASSALRTSDRVYTELVSAIRELRIPPGASLSEAELAEQLHVSRTPLREAIGRLVSHGLVSVIPQVGTRVERIRLADVEQAQFVRENLELAAYTEACSHSERDLSPLRALLVEQEDSHAIHDVDAFFVADEALHEAIFTMSGYPGAWHAMQPVKLQLDRLRRLSLPDPATIRTLIDEHAAIVAALEAGDTEVGRTLVRAHARRVLDYGPAIRARHPELFSE